MDNVIWIILASAVFIALAGILLAIGGDELTGLGDEADNISDHEKWTSYSPGKIDPDSNTVTVEASIEDIALRPV